MAYGELSNRLSDARFTDEDKAVSRLLEHLALTETQRKSIFDQTHKSVIALRDQQSFDLLEEFLAEYGLSTDEGIALMCLAEAYLRTPDESSLDALIRDKIGSGHWEQHLGTARSLLINASSWGLMLTGKLLNTEESDHQKIDTTLKDLIRRLSEPAIRVAVEQVMKILGRQFVLGSTIQAAMKRAADTEKLGYTHSYDMLGEAAMTDRDARAYLLAYSKAITAISERAAPGSAMESPEISVKLSALHPRYETVQFDRVMNELVPRVASLAQLARSANIGFTVDAEESERLEISLNVIQAVLENPTLQGWKGFGVVVQAYLKQAPYVIDWLYSLAEKLDRQITVRLVKGAYWDYEIKNAQLQGLQNYPVFTRKQSTDLCYLVCAEKLIQMSDRIFPQFATHNAHTAHSILEIAGDKRHFEFQRLHGMGEALHERLRKLTGKASRIYAPVGIHKDLLAYLVRRLLENGANSSFIHQLHDDKVPTETIAADPVKLVMQQKDQANPMIPAPPQLFGSQRLNSSGLAMNLPAINQQLDDGINKYTGKVWQARPASILSQDNLAERKIFSPIDKALVGKAFFCKPSHVEQAVSASGKGYTQWNQLRVEKRADVLDRIADLYEQHRTELTALAIREAGKTRLDAILEIREAVDFCRYYAVQAREKLIDSMNGRGPFVCISPWNFPLAIFTGQIAAALVAGNSVLAKPAEQTPLIAALAVELMHRAGVPEDVLILLPGEGADVGAALTRHPKIAGVCFTGSTQTAELIDRSLAKNSSPGTPLIAETGGINAMFVDSTALPEQAVKHIISSAFQSAGQRCSALRLLLIQDDIADDLLSMLEGASQQLAVGDPGYANVDIGPIIDQDALDKILTHCDDLESKGRLLFKVPISGNIPDGNFISPAVYSLEQYEELKEEVFGPVLHVLTYKQDQLEPMVDKINDSGYGLTLGMQSRIDERIETVCGRANVGNIYINRNQIGAVVGVQPFGGEGKSGTGPKAGGPFYLYRFCTISADQIQRLPPDKRQMFEDNRESWENSHCRRAALRRFAEYLPPSLCEVVNTCLDDFADFSSAPLILDGPTGEMNTIGLYPRGEIYCLGDSGILQDATVRQVTLCLLGGNSISLPSGELADRIGNSMQQAGIASQLLNIRSDDTADILASGDIQAVACDYPVDELKTIRQLLACREGARIPLLSAEDDISRYTTERVISIDTTAAGGNASLLAN